MQPICETVNKDGIAKAAATPSVINSFAFRGDPNIGGELVAFYVDEWNDCNPRPTTTTVERQTPAPENGFIVFPSGIALSLPIGQGPGEVRLPPGAVSTRTVIQLVEFDYNPVVDGEPDGEWRIASSMVKFKSDQPFGTAVRFRLFVDTALT